MYKLDELLKIKEQFEEQQHLPIQDFVDWEFLIGFVDSHIKASEKS